MSTRPLLIATALGSAALLTLTACGGSSSGASAPTTPASGTAAGVPNANGGTGTGSGGARPGASGTIAAVEGTTMQVQNQQTGQVAVSWTGSTTFSQQVKVAASSIKAGDCVTAIAASGSQTDTTLTATTVSVSQQVNGECTGRRGGFPGGARPSDAPTGAVPGGGTPPSGFPTDRPSGSAGGGNFGAIASGKVVSVSGSTIVVAARDFSASRPADGSTPSAAPSATTTNKTVSLTAATKITTQQKATASAVKVGRCANAQGKADDTGAVTATSISITDPVNGQCNAFGGFGRPARNGTGTGGTGD